MDASPEQGVRGGSFRFYEKDLKDELYSRLMRR
jgi:hypothetical protein